MSSANFTLCQIEIPVSDVNVALRFYAEVFGWNLVPAEMIGYYILDVPSDYGFGISLVPTHEGKPSQVKSYASRLYFKCQTPDKTIEVIKTCGGKVLGTAVDRPGYGMTWRFQDPDENQFGLFQPKSDRY